MNSLNVSVVGFRGRPRNDVANAAKTNPSIKYQNKFPDDGVFSGRLEGLEFGPEGGGASGGGASEFDMVSNAAGRRGTTGINVTADFVAEFTRIQGARQSEFWRISRLRAQWN
jgi:hypothetical protein